MFLENEENQEMNNHLHYDPVRPGVDHLHHHNHHPHTPPANHDQQPNTADHQLMEDSEGRSMSSSPTSVTSYRGDLSGCEDFDAQRIQRPVLDPPGSMTGGSNNNNNNNNNNKEQKPKKHKCKHCGLECTEKVQYWKHIRLHIKPEQLLECPNCEFVTDLKHHYEYHLLNHTGAKPFTCPDCDYKCVSKSMLQSHLKSHSNVFQFQCYDCGYASKYMHSLKQHLKKRDHRPATPLNPDGTPNPEIVIDVVGNRRGPRQNKKQSRQHPYRNQTMTSQQQQQDDGGGSSSGGHPSPYSMQQLLQMQPAVVGGPAAYPTSAESFMYSMITKRSMVEMVDYHNEYLAITNNNNNNNNSTAVDDKMDVVQQLQQQYEREQNQWRLQRQQVHHRGHQFNHHHAEDAGAGGRTPEPPVPAVAMIEPKPLQFQQQQQQVAVPAPAETAGPLNLSKDHSFAPRAAGSSRRKGIACKLERPSVEPQAKAAEETTTPQQQQQQQPMTTVVVKKEVISLRSASLPDQVQQRQQSLSPEKDEETTTHVCHHCDIIFKENIMYSMHMGFHSFRNPFACNLCGEIMTDKFSFFAHIARVPHG